MNTALFHSKDDLTAYAVKLQQHLSLNFDKQLDLDKVQQMLAELEGYQHFDSFPDKDSNSTLGIKIKIHTGVSSGTFFDVFSEYRYGSSEILCIEELMDSTPIPEDFDLDEVIRLLSEENVKLREALSSVICGSLSDEKLQWLPALLIFLCYAGGHSLEENASELELLIKQVEKINELIGFKQNQALVLAKAILFSVFRPDQEALRELIKSTVRRFPIMWSSWTDLPILSISMPIYPDKERTSVAYDPERLTVGYPFWFRGAMEEAADSITKAYFSKTVQAYFQENLDAFFLGGPEDGCPSIPAADLLGCKATLEKRDNSTLCFMERANYRIPEDWD